MAMDGKQLGDEIAQAIMENVPEDVQKTVEKLWQKIGSAIVAHIQTNGEVLPGIGVSTAGTAAAQTGATTETGKII